jgi:hypothetical protein
MTETLPLSTSIQAHGDTLAALVFREPTGKDIRVHGNPFQLVADRVTGEATPVFDADRCARLISALAGIPMSSVDQLSAADFLGAQLVLLGFFGVPPPKTGSNASSTSAGSGATSAPSST